ncbi:MAG: hypothetical protein QXX48_04470 [Candidatus Korarchaeum sp.]
MSLLIDPDTGKLYDQGTVLDVIARVRSWKDSIYLSPVLIIKVRDPNAILLRELEILRRELRIRVKPKKDEENLMRDLIRILKDLGPLSADEVADLLKEDHLKLKRKLDEMASYGLLQRDEGRYSYIGHY